MRVHHDSAHHTLIRGGRISKVFVTRERWRREDCAVNKKNVQHIAARGCTLDRELVSFFLQTGFLTAQPAQVVEF